MADQTIGTCSICGGRVAIPAAWLGIKPPIPTCDSCGAIKRKPYGPTVDMTPVKRVGTKLVSTVRFSFGAM